MQIAFAVTSKGGDYYSAMTRIAIASLRTSNPGLKILVACDRNTNDALRTTGDELINETDSWLVIDTPPGNDDYCNRYVKTRLRCLIEGPFLFLDSDIFVRRPLNEIFELDCDIAGARNHSREVFSEQIWNQDRATIEAMDWAIGNSVYINGGVLFFNDTDATRELAEEWHRRWLESSARQNSYRDQPALNSALEACRPRLTVLPDCFNAQIIPSPETAVDAMIWHFYSSATRPAWTGFDLLVQRLLDGERLDPEEISRYATLRHPWIDAGVVAAGLQLASLRSECTLLKRELEKTHVRLTDLQRDHEHHQQVIQEILDSSSWKITRPLRYLDTLVKRLKSGPSDNVEQ